MYAGAKGETNDADVTSVSGREAGVHVFVGSVPELLSPVSLLAKISFVKELSYVEHGNAVTRT
jgi:hypothetical protein